MNLDTFLMITLTAVTVLSAILYHILGERVYLKYTDQKVVVE